MLFRLPLSTVFLVFICITAAFADDLPKEGDVLPELVFSAPPHQGDAEILGIQPGQKFGLAELERDVILMEVIGVYCAECAKQSPLFNDLFNRLKRRKLLDRVAFIAMAAGATPMEANYLRESGKYAFPVVHDQKYELHKKLSEAKTPFTMLVRPDGTVLFAHLGVYDDVDDLYEKIKGFTESDGTQ